MNFLLNHCTLYSFNQDVIDECHPFSCGHEDLDDFFHNESIAYQHELIGKSYCFRLDEDPRVIVCAFTVSNDSIKVNDLPNSRKKKVSKDIPRKKHFRSYPSVLIGRLGVNKDYASKHIGSELMDFIKSWFIDPFNKTGCRFLVVDSYNEEIPMRYYTQNGFITLFSTDEQEKEYMGLTLEDELRTRLMYFDLIVLSNR